jgi:hypothetical protein
VSRSEKTKLGKNISGGSFRHFILTLEYRINWSTPLGGIARGFHILHFRNGGIQKIRGIT